MIKSLRPITLLAAVFALFLLNGCLNDDNKIPPNCYDHILNNGEQLVDCGGANCPACDHCIDGIWQPELGETCVDCGGECGPCPQCANCIQDADEAGIDCGGSACGPCSDLCNDGILNGTETQVDCGGAYCDACPTCTDGLMNGTEIGIDCGGTNCPPCSTDGNCTNGMIDGNEFWTDCGGSTCMACDTLCNFSANSVANVGVPGTATFAVSSGNITITCSTLQGGTMAFTMKQPIGGWQNGSVLTIDPTSVPNSAVVYTNSAGVAHSTAFTGSSITVTVIKYASSPVPGGIRFNFSGTLKNNGGTSVVNIANGLTMTPLQ
jgi:hypothetical protein